MKTRIFILLIVITVLTSCEGFFGTKTDLSFIDAPDYSNRASAYVPIQPILDEFLQPTDVIVGYDALFYVVDAGTEEIIGYDQSGREQGRFQLQGVSKIAMDRNLDILAIGTLDTNINGSDYVLSCIYRLNLDGPLGYGISHAAITKKIIHPFYFKSSFSNADELVKFTSIDVMADNYYFVSRTGPRDNESQVGGTDDGILLFKFNDKYVSSVFITASTGIYRGYFKTPLCVTALAKPPQSPSVTNSRDFYVTMSDPTVPIKVQCIKYSESDFGSSFELALLDFSDTSKAHDFLYRPNRFIAPTDMTLAGDGTNYLFVVDKEKDSLYVFNNKGLEGVNPPPGSSEKKPIIVSFGGKGEGPTQFNKPSAVAYLDKILYITDEGNGRLLRFKLTTDFD